MVLADVDGTLVDSQKRITARAHEAIKRLRADVSKISSLAT
ncbi:MAG: HAD hydrolase family protein [Chthoniobacterales bacterium]